jgi:hypothetical protein
VPPTTTPHDVAILQALAAWVRRAPRIDPVTPEYAVEYSSPVPPDAVEHACNAMGTAQFDRGKLADGLGEIRRRYLTRKRFDMPQRWWVAGNGPGLTRLSKELSAIHMDLLAAAEKIAALNLPVLAADLAAVRALALCYQDLAVGVAASANRTRVWPSLKTRLIRDALKLFNDLGGKSTNGSYVRFVRAAACGAGIKEWRAFSANTIRSERRRLGMTV